jgi:hypothetical protein
MECGDAGSHGGGPPDVRPRRAIDDVQGAANADRRAGHDAGARKAAPAKTAKPKRAPVKKAKRKVKQPVAPVVETTIAEVIEQPAPGVISVTEVEETEVRKAS